MDTWPAINPGPPKPRQFPLNTQAQGPAPNTQTVKSNTTILRPNVHKIKPLTFPLSPNIPLQPNPSSSRNTHQHLQPNKNPQQHKSSCCLRAVAREVSRRLDRHVHVLLLVCGFITDGLPFAGPGMEGFVVCEAGRVC